VALLGALAAQRRDWHDLESIGSQLIKIAPNATEGYTYHATARANQGDVATADVDFNHIIKLRRRVPLVHSTRSSAYRAKTLD
jgi:hypothetical protein